ncbi:hypothetical protein HMPREF9120_02089 [Neisseria sp. oral taxon 020 str. F0370]|nr:hypothetical protein HMPREF9120_02089 [Neisseria sp. oral taxon 020 str. F0370]
MMSSPCTKAADYSRSRRGKNGALSTAALKNGVDSLWINHLCP